MSDLKDLNRAVQSAVFPGHHWAQAVREWIGAATERMEGGGGISVECVEADSGYLCTKLAGHEGEHLALGLANGERHHWPKKPASEGGKVEPEFDEVPQQTIGELVRQAASEGGKVECPNHCGEMVYEDMEHYCKPAQSEPASTDVGIQCLGCGDTERPCRCEGYSPEPVAHEDAEFMRDGSMAMARIIERDEQPEPVAAEMPEAVSVNTWQLEELLKYADLAEVSLRTGFHPPEFLFEPADRSLRQCIDAIKEQRDQWRVHAARPAPAVAMSPELERVLDFAWSQACETDGYTQPRVEADILAVRAQAAEAGKVRLPKVNEAIRLLEDWRKFGDLETNEMPYGDTAAFLAAEGKVAG